jgi:hypothetical protein
MSKFSGNKRLFPFVVGAVAFAMTAPASMGKDKEELEIDEAELFFELNDTDGDLGIQGLVDGDEWKRLEITDASGRKLMNILVRGALRLQGMTEFFFESDEPTFDDLSPEEFFARFPEGEYEIEATTLDGEELEGEVELSHVMAGPPTNIMVNDEESAVNCDAAELPVVSEPVTISWQEPTLSHPTIGTPGVAITIRQYLVVGEFEREGETPDELVFEVDLPAGVTSFEFPEDFTGMAEEEIKFEIVTQLDNGNKTAVESCFEVE